LKQIHFRQSVVVVVNASVVLLLEVNEMTIFMWQTSFNMLQSYYLVENVMKCS
jgi:hypothetical protein